MSIYRFPSTNARDCLHELQCVFIQLLSNAKYVIIAGDFNINSLDSPSIQRDYVNLFSDFQFLQYVAEPTRVTDLSATLIDHMLTSSPLCVTTCTQAVGLSDHQSQLLEVVIPVVRNLPRHITIRSFHNCP